MKFLIKEESLILLDDMEFNLPYYDFMLDFLNITFANDVFFMTLISNLKFYEGNYNYSNTKVYLLKNLVMNFIDKIHTDKTATEILIDLQNDLLEVIRNNFLESTTSYDSTSLTKILSSDKYFKVNLLSDLFLYKDILYQRYEVNDLYSYSMLIISILYNSGKVINKCNNCGRYFIPLTRNDEIYCDTVHENLRTCKMMGYENKVKDNPVTKEYRRIYKNKHSLKQRQRYINPNIEDQFNTFAQDLKFIVEAYKQKNITEEQAIMKLKEHERRFY